MIIDLPPQHPIVQFVENVRQSVFVASHGRAVAPELSVQVSDEGFSVLNGGDPAFSYSARALLQRNRVDINARVSAKMSAAAQNASRKVAWTDNQTFMATTVIHEVLHFSNPHIGTGDHPYFDGESPRYDRGVEEAVVEAVALDLFPKVEKRLNVVPGFGKRAMILSVYFDCTSRIRIASAIATKTKWTSSSAKYWRMALLTSTVTTRNEMLRSTGTNPADVCPIVP